MPAPMRGALMMLVATAAFACMHASIRAASTGLHPFEIAFFRNFFALFFLLPVLMRTGFGVLRTQRLGLYVLRGTLNTAAMLAFFFALSITPLVQVTALSFTAPLFATLGAALILGEMVRGRRWAAILIGFAGTLVILRPGLVALDTGSMLVIGSSAMWALAILCIKKLSATETSVAITVYMALVMAPLTGLAALPFWQWPSGEQYLMLGFIALLGTIAQTCMNQALHEADASAVLPFDFAKLIWTSILGYVLFFEIPDLWTYVGGAMIFGAATYIGIRESRLKRQGKL
ncbi:DMT family transporter [Oceanibaculum pacificum]|nr:DMT family transporter [Oceanibaculum pacificum]